jgi:hypothetical protein
VGARHVGAGGYAIEKTSLIRKELAPDCVTGRRSAASAKTGKATIYNCAPDADSILIYV